MLNYSKISDPRFWNRWRLSGAVGIGLPSRPELLKLFKVDGPEQPLPGVIAIGGDFYVKKPGALNSLLSALRIIGYEIDNLREADHRQRDGVTAERMEREGLSLWYGHLDNRRGKCNSCGGLIRTEGIRCHGHRCELCGAVTYYEIVDGSVIRFSFIQNGPDPAGMADIRMTAKRWDTKAGYLYLYPEVAAGLWLRQDKAQAYFDANSDKWEAVEEDGQRLIRVRYRNTWKAGDSVINPSDISRHSWNHKIVLVWEGREYEEFFSNLPVRESINIYEAWHWAPLHASPTLHKKVLGAVHDADDKGWHYQDGRQWFTTRKFAEMEKFVRHFTTLDADAWKRASKRFRLDGPGGIDDIAAFCHPHPEVENRPNIGNLLEGMAKIGRITRGSKDRISENEMTAMADAWKDPEVSRDFSRVMTAYRNGN